MLYRFEIMETSSNTTTWVEYVTALGSVLTPMLVLILTAVGWKLRSKIERQIKLEELLRKDRVEIYNRILAPFIMLFMTDHAWKTDPKNRNKNQNQLATQLMLSLEYRETAFQMSLMGSDAVVKAYNDLMQLFFHHDESKDFDFEEVGRLLGTFLLEIRRSMGNESTNLDHWEMLEWFITDARKYRIKNKSV